MEKLGFHYILVILHQFWVKKLSLKIRSSLIGIPTWFPIAENRAKVGKNCPPPMLNPNYLFFEFILAIKRIKQCFLYMIATLQYAITQFMIDSSFIFDWHPGRESWSVVSTRPWSHDFVSTLALIALLRSWTKRFTTLSLLGGFGKAAS